MARSRVFKADFFRSRSLSKCSIPARLTYIGLWTESDDRGRGKADPDVLCGAIWPLDRDVTPAVFTDHLCELVQTNHIRLYTADEDVFFHILKWEKHQAAAYRRGEPKHPDPDDETVCTIVHADECRTVLGFGVGSSLSGNSFAARRTPDDDPPAVDKSGEARRSEDMDDFDRAVTAAVDVRRERNDVHDEARWEPAARRGIIKDYGLQLRRLLDEGHTPADAGAISMGALAPFRPKNPTPAAPDHSTACECEGTGWVSTVDGYVRRCVRDQADMPDATIHELRGAS